MTRVTPTARASAPPTKPTVLAVRAASYEPAWASSPPGSGRRGPGTGRAGLCPFASATSPATAPVITPAPPTPTPTQPARRSGGIAGHGVGRQGRELEYHQLRRRLGEGDAQGLRDRGVGALRLDRVRARVDGAPLAEQPREQRLAVDRHLDAGAERARRASSRASRDRGQELLALRDRVRLRLAHDRGAPSRSSCMRVTSR